MNAIELLNDVQARGIQLVAEEGRLRFRPRAAVTPELLETIKQHKAELLALLAGDAVPDDAEEQAKPTGKPRCPSCFCERVRDVPIHRGESVRRDCRKCGRFLAFVTW